MFTRISSASDFVAKQYQRFEKTASVEDQLRQLAHEREMLQNGLLKSGERLHEVDGGSEAVDKGDTTQMLSIADKNAGFALEMQIQIKRAEREKKRNVIELD